MLHEEAKDNGKVEVAHVDAGAVQVTGTATGTVNVPVQSGAIQATGTLANNFEQPLATVTAPVHVDAPMTVQKGAFEFSLYPRAFSLNFDEGSISVPVNVKLDLGPAAKELAAAIKPAQDAAHDAAIVWKYKDWILGGGLVLAAALAAWLHGRNRGHKATIAALTKLAGMVAICLTLNGCADVIFTASGALAPKVAMGVAAAGAAGTLVKSAVDGVSAIEELKAEFKGKNPKKPDASPAAVSSTGGTVQPAQAAAEKSKEATK